MIDNRFNFTGNGLFSQAAKVSLLINNGIIFKCLVGTSVYKFK
jgi:hypothetical protein